MDIGGEPGKSEGQRRIVSMGVMHEKRFLPDIGDLDDAQLPIDSHHDTALAVGTEANLLTVMEVDDHLRALFASGDVLERAVVEHVAVLEDLDERRAPVGVRRTEHLGHVFAIEVVGSGNETGFGAEGHGERIERLIDRSERGRFRDLAQFRSG